MPAPVDLHLSKAVVLPQPPDRRNGNIVTNRWRRRFSAVRMSRLAQALILLLALPGSGLARPAGLDWHYQPGVDDRMARTTDCAVRPMPGAQQPNPIVLPQPAPLKRRNPVSEKGWYFTNPQLATGRPDAFKDNREAVRIAQAQQDQVLLANRPLPESFDQLPDAFQGLNYRIELGLLYRF